MAVRELIEIEDRHEIGTVMFSFIEEMYPICRSITGDGVRKTLDILKKIIPLEVIEIETGTKVFDWTVPDEWNIKDAYIKNARGEKIVDFKKLNLHVVNYSVPVHKKIGLTELKGHCHTIPEHPEWVPYRTSYHNKAWGFCLSDKLFTSLEDEEYEVLIDSTLKPGSLSYGEYFIQGELDDEVLIYSHICHPSLCNDNLSGLVVASHLANCINKSKPKYSYRFVFAPGTIGSITWLSQNEQRLSRIKHGLVVALVGDSGCFTYKKSRIGNTEIDRAVLAALKGCNTKYEVLEFSPYGYDERQFCSPGINLPVGRITRSPNGSYPEYHTSADNLDFINKQSLENSLSLCVDIINIIENNQRYKNTNPKCEPQLGKRGLYQKTGGRKEIGLNEFALLWLLNYSDGEHDLLDIVEKSGLPFADILLATDKLIQVGLLSD